MAGSGGGKAGKAVVRCVFVGLGMEFVAVADLPSLSESMPLRVSYKEIKTQ